MKILRQLDGISKATADLDKKDYDPDSSGFHMEVASVLDIIRIRYALEVKQQPFILDLLITTPSYLFLKEGTVQESVDHQSVDNQASHDGGQVPILVHDNSDSDVNVNGRESYIVGSGVNVNDHDEVQRNRLNYVFSEV